MDKFRQNKMPIRYITYPIGICYAQSLAEHLFKEKQRVSVCREGKNNWYIPLSGKVKVEGNDKVLAKVNIWFGVETTNPPNIWVKEPWISPVFSDQNQNRSDWHRFEEDEKLGVRICWIFPEDWASVLNNGRVASVAGQIAQNLKYWLSCHRIAYEQHLLNWSADWPFVSHRKKGA